MFWRSTGVVENNLFVKQILYEVENSALLRYSLPCGLGDMRLISCQAARLSCFSNWLECVVLA